MLVKFVPLLTYSQITTVVYMLIYTTKSQESAHLQYDEAMSDSSHLSRRVRKLVEPTRIRLGS